MDDWKTRRQQVFDILVSTTGLQVVIASTLRSKKLKQLLSENVARLHEVSAFLVAPIPMLLWCPQCSERHIDEGVWADRHHHTHACQHCGHVWRPAAVATVGVQYLPGFKNE